MFKDNKNYYPTPETLAIKMIAKIKNNPTKILEPSAGKGALITAIINNYHYCANRQEIFAIEKNQEFQAILRDKKIKVLDSDFLQFSGPDKFDLIISNPPFDAGDAHLLKALDIMYRGQIIFLLNAETLRNPYTNNRKLLVEKLLKFNAEIEYIKNAFLDAERKTGVEIALVNIILIKKLKMICLLVVVIKPQTQTKQQRV